MCLYPRLAKNPKYKPNKKNKGKPPKCEDERQLWIPVACGECIECRRAKAREWTMRLYEELRDDKNASFVTMTFSEEAYQKLGEDVMEQIAEIEDENEAQKKMEDIENQIAKRAIELWRKRVNKQRRQTYRHWLITELGHEGTERLHIHGIIWGIENKETIEKLWSYGWVDTGEYVDGRTINYIVKYVTKIDKGHPRFKGKIFTSKGIGSGYLKRRDAKKHRYNKEETNETYRTPNGKKINLPIYFRNKLYTEEQREKLWANKLDKQERWVRGERIDVSTRDGMKQYFKALEWHRIKNKELGYGQLRDWNREIYTDTLKSLTKKE